MDEKLIGTIRAILKQNLKQAEAMADQCREHWGKYLQFSGTDVYTYQNVFADAVKKAHWALEAFDRWVNTPDPMEAVLDVVCEYGWDREKNQGFLPVFLQSNFMALRRYQNEKELEYCAKADCPRKPQGAVSNDGLEIPCPLGRACEAGCGPGTSSPAMYGSEGVTSASSGDGSF